MGIRAFMITFLHCSLRREQDSTNRTLDSTPRLDSLSTRFSTRLDKSTVVPDSRQTNPKMNPNRSKMDCGGLGGIRTHDLRLRRPPSWSWLDYQPVKHERGLRGLISDFTMSP